MREIYLDFAATTPVDPRVMEAMEPYVVREYGNPSSLHTLGREAKQVLDGARATVAGILRARPDEVVFTGGGTEAINLAVFGVARKYRDRGMHLITTKIEHHAVLHAHEALVREGYEVTYLKPDRDGLIDPDDVRRALRDDTIMVSIMYANNEIGTVEPIAQIAGVIKDFSKERNTADVPPFFFTDACQAGGALDLDVLKLGVDLMAINGSKIYGPKGVGALYIRRAVKPMPLIYGGGQERGMRSGTENVSGIIGLARALALAEKERVQESARQITLRDYFISKILKQIPSAELNGHAERRLPNNINISIPGIEGEAAVLYLDTKGVYVSTGSACSSATIEPSHVVLALGKSRAHAEGSLRFSMGKHTTKEDLEYVVEVLSGVIAKLHTR